MNINGSGAGPKRVKKRNPNWDTAPKRWPFQPEA